MTRLIQPFIFLAAFYSAIYSAMANAKVFEINVSFITGPGQPTRLILTNQYCMSKVPNVIGLEEGKTTFNVDTNGGAFTKCGWVHSSATFEAQNSKKEKKLVFEVYKPLGKFAYIKILWPSNPNCYTNGDCLLCGLL